MTDLLDEPKLGSATRPAERRPRGPLRSFIRKPLGVLSLLFIAAVCTVSFGASLFAPYNPLDTDFSDILSGPSSRHLLGTDELGRDVLSRLMYGGSPMIIATVEAVVIAIFLGTTVGLITGYFRGRVDRALSWFGDVLLSIPVLVVLLVILTVNTQTLTPAAVALGVLLSVGPMRVVRSVALSVREELYIDAARVSGLSHRQVIARHVLPRVTGPVIVQASLLSAVALLTVTGVAFLGLGVNPPAPTWGSMVAEAASVMQEQGWYIVPTGGIIALTVLALGLLGDTVHDVLAERSLAPVPRGSARVRRLRARADGDSPRAGAAADMAVSRAEQRPPVLAVRDLAVVVTRGDGEVRVVDGVSFQVHAAEIVGVVGESGSGKTLTARAVLGLLPPGARVVGGQAWLNGRGLVGQSRRALSAVRRKHVAYISQDPMISLDPTFTVGHTLREALYYREQLGRSGWKARATELLEAVRLPSPDQVLHRYPHQLSGGMAQRVAIARSLAGRPELLIADEPTTALDVTVQSEILQLLRTLRDDTGMSILFITHNWGVVADLCDRAVVMYAGQIVENGSVDELFNASAHPYTSALLASSPYFARSGERLSAIPGAVPPPWEWPDGCRFQKRCTLVTDACRHEAIGLLDISAGHASRCLHVDELLQGRA
jgi:peptide/nickel transport system permease protein